MLSLLQSIDGATSSPRTNDLDCDRKFRRSAVSVSANIVEGSARNVEGEYVNHLNIALGSAAELQYLVDLAGRLYPNVVPAGNALPEQAGEVVRVLAGLIDGLKRKA